MKYNKEKTLDALITVERLKRTLERLEEHGCFGIQCNECPVFYTSPMCKKMAKNMIKALEERRV